MRRYGAVAIAAVLLFGAIWMLIVVTSPKLPRKQLAAGGEFRVVQVTYGAGKMERHFLGRSPEFTFWMHRHLPPSLQNRIPFPNEGLSASGHVDRVISIWWAWFGPSGNPQVGPTDYPLMTLDSGKQVRLGWPKPSNEFRQTIVTNPPTDSRRLRFSLLVEEEQVDFEIVNPAFVH
ncbi:MAG: hypothetical protein EOP84_03920 [Verrucomicrobiaceae bacterium]|nr:MAG: hypothetical protein EOP84_03920 [Verrucomicrobiaceae bacterium]